MRSTFTGFNAAKSGLFASQRSLDVIGHNISNINTPGYTRQRADQVNADPSHVSEGWLGNGVKMEKIIQIRDEFLDVKFRNEAALQSYWDEKNNTLRMIESVFGEPKGNGIRQYMNDFFNSINTVIMNPKDPTTRSTMVATAMTFTNYFNSVVDSFETMIKDTNQEVEAQVVQINTKAKQIASLNSLIYEAEINNETANDFRDRRNVLLDELSKMADIKVKKSLVVDDKTGKSIEKINVLFENGVLISHTDVNELKLKDTQFHPLYLDSQKYNIPPRDDLKFVRITDVTWADNTKLDMNKVGGSLGSQLQQRDSYGDPSANCPVKGIPYYVRVVNEFSRAFANKVNEIHRKGVDVEGNPGVDFFIADGESAEINARNIRVNQDIVNAPTKLAVGKTKDDDDSKNFQELYAMRNEDMKVSIKQNIAGHYKNLDIGKGIPENILFSQITSVLGVDGKEAVDNYLSQERKTEELDMMRMSVSSVSENEELTNMVKYQHAYNACARMITTVDEMLDIIINRLGRVGL